ncbi:PIN domain-containing protein [candidate division KSB1 bacterium]|nr:PIN domain-containing protein [candidate division KSB1 bacterium]
MGQIILPDTKYVYVDANAVIYSVEKIEPYFTLLKSLWQAAQRSQFLVISSELVILETLVKPLKESDKILESCFREFLLASQEVLLIPIDLSILEQAASLRATTGLKPPDAIHAATALTKGNIPFVTNDPNFKRVSGLSVMILQEILSI